MNDAAPAMPEPAVKKMRAPAPTLDLKYQYIQDYNRCKTPAEKFNTNRQYILKMWPNESINIEQKDDKMYLNKLTSLRRIRRDADRIETFVESVSVGVAAEQERRPPSRKRKNPFSRLPPRSKEVSNECRKQKSAQCTDIAPCAHYM